MNLETLTLYDLMGEDHDVYIRKNEKFGYDMEVSRDAPEESFTVNVHDFAADALAVFCRMYLAGYEREQDK
jgi:hypothetical protein